MACVSISETTLKSRSQRSLQFKKEGRLPNIAASRRMKNVSIYLETGRKMGLKSEDTFTTQTLTVNTMDYLEEKNPSSCELERRKREIS